MSKLPKLTVAKLEAYFYAPYFERGRSYYRKGYVIDPIRRGNTLEARCFGSMPNPYRVRATLSSTGIESTDCSCPIGGGCKHVAALLLAWVHNPEAFNPRKSVDDILKERGKSELIGLIKEMLKRAPDLEILLDLPLPGGKPRRDPVDPEPYRQQVRAAFYGAEDWNSHFRVASDMGAITGMADQFAEAGDWRNAEIIYQVVVEGGLANYGDAVHDEGEILGEITRAAEGLGGCLQAYEGNPIARQKILHSLFEVVRWDTDMGGYGMGDTISETLFEQANGEELPLLRGWIMREAAKADNLEGYSRQWRKEAWGRFLQMIDEREGDIDGFLERARSQGMYRSLFDKLVELDRIEEAVEVAAVHLRDSDYEFLQSVLTLENAGYPSEAVAMIAPKASEIKDTRLLAWLAEKYETGGNMLEALNVHLRQWQIRPSMPDFQALERVAKATNQWETLRPRLIAGLAEGRHFNVLARVHLYEESWDAAWEAANQGRHGYWNISIQEEVARVTETHRPQQAIAFYIQRAEQLIAQRGRDNYAEASRYLLRVRNINAATGQMDAWERTIRSLRETNRNLPALLDELNKAGL